MTAARIVGIDSLRFWLALWVYFSHFGLLPFKAWLDRGTPWDRFAIGVLGNLFNGAAAVIVFFVISGFCIHLPYTRTVRLPLAQFYLRRLLRVVPPLLVALAFTLLVGDGLLEFYKAIVWSVVAEMIYYALYPLLRRVWVLVGWEVTLSISYLLAAGVIVVDGPAMNFHEYGASLTWLVGLPSWLLGCYLAESWDATPAPLITGRIWKWRLMVWALSSITSVLRFHAGVGYPISLTVFGFVIFYWLSLELNYYLAERPMRVFESAGAFSYSIYLVHGLAAASLKLVAPSFVVEHLLLASFVRLALVLVTSYGFYLIVERPSHTIARWAAHRLGPTLADPQPA